MKVKRFTANDMRSALRQIRDEQGDEAVILSSCRTAHGVEVVAATDYDEALASQLMARTQPVAPERKRPVPATRPAPATRPEPAARAAPAAPADKKPAARAAAPLRPVAATRSGEGIDSVRRELAAMRRMIENEMSRFAEERLRGVPVRAMVLDELIDSGCDRELARSIAAALPAGTTPQRARGLVLGMLAKSLVIPATDPVDGGGVFALVGPSGVGKTTTVAKLAARYAATHSRRDVALVTTDIGRAGGREQLITLGRRLGMPVFEAKHGAGLAQLLQKLADYPLVLIDTGGLGPRDQPLSAQFVAVQSPRRVRSLLVLPATAQAADLNDVIRRFRSLAPEALILSKIDETGRLGTGLSTIIRHRLPLVYVTDGQVIPDDLHRAEAHRLVIRMGEQRRASRAGSSQEVAHATA